MTVGMPQLERYRLDQVLGAGGMTLVYRGYDTELARPVAVKLLADNLADDPSFRQRFLREARAAARLSHPSIVHVYDVGELAGRPYFVMEYVEGETVARRLHRRGRLPVAEALAIGLAVCNGLDHAHTAGLVHRDIKPQNLLLPADGGVKIVDFGIARMLDGTAITETGTLLGTAAYISPEQIAGLTATAKADLYALGVVIFELVSGTPPFPAETLTQALLARELPSLPSLLDAVEGVPPALDLVVSRCLSLAPERRPTARELRAALAGVAHELNTGEPASPTSEQPRSPLRSRPTRARTRVAETEATERRAVVRHRLSRLSVPVVVVLVVLAVLLHLQGGGHAAPSSSRPVSSTPAPAAARARALSAWLRANSR